MNIALMSHDNKKELMVQFCTAYCGILAKHTLCATARTGQQIADATGLTIHRFLSFDHGGRQGTAPLGYVGEIHQRPVGEAQGQIQVPQANVAVQAQDLFA